MENGFLEETLVIHLYNILTKRLDIGLNSETTVPDPHELVFEKLAITPEDVDRLVEELEGARGEIDEFFNYLNG